MRIKRRTKRFIRRVVLSIPVILAGTFLYLYFRRPSSAPPENIRVDMSPNRIERGRYLFTGLADCDGCHSQRDFTRLGNPVIESGRGQGAVMPLQDLPGQIVAGNLTLDRETGLGSWTDGEKIRAIREGVDKTGRTLFPIMPYQRYKFMSDEDVESVVAYMNSLPPVRNALPPTQITFPASMFIKSAPEPVGRKVSPVSIRGGEVYGEYLATLADCEDCHTPLGRHWWSNGQPDPSLRFAGGRIFATPYGTVASSNITPDLNSGIGQWDFIRFRDRMRGYRQNAGAVMPPARPERFTLMPWDAYVNITDIDLESLFIYVKGQAAIAHKVDPHPGYPADPSQSQ